MQAERHDDTFVLPLVEEEVRVDTRTVTTGRVTVRTVTETVEEVARVALSGEEVEVERVPVGRRIDAPPPVREENGVLIVPVIEEVAVVETHLVLREELRRRETSETVEVPVTLRKQRAEVDRLPARGETPGEDTPPDRDRQHEDQQS
jgi:stress response protein YsnF